MSRLRLGLSVLLILLYTALVWQTQNWRYGRLLAQQAQAQAVAMATRVLEVREQNQRLERQLHESETRHYQELSNAQQSQARLRDRLATADVRLSALVERDAACAAVPTAAGAGGVDHASVRARLEPAHAARIIAITDEGDRGLMALRACQDYVRGLLR
ncbi:lysis system i-spanin subunit Rz [Pseudomonas putida]|uniref:Phage protein n=1 Tax=Pseudomonas putida (strain W619) TaxID=390235 RepID=B1JDA4_PSEPW